jgi:Na+-driven multidrug efflux pump
MVFLSSSMFQAIGNTVPPLLTSFLRIALIAAAIFFIVRMPRFELRWIWYLSIAAVIVQMTLNLLLLRREFRIRLRFDPAPSPVGASS